MANCYANKNQVGSSEDIDKYDLIVRIELTGEERKLLDITMKDDPTDFSKIYATKFIEYLVHGTGVLDGGYLLVEESKDGNIETLVYRRQSKH